MEEAERYEQESNDESSDQGIVEVNQELDGFLLKEVLIGGQG